MVRGQRVMFFSGEFHPFRLPAPGLWLDVLQKVKAMGFNGVSFYVNWALLEGKEGDFSAEGVFALEPFFEAAKTAGKLSTVCLDIYRIIRRLTPDRRYLSPRTTWTLHQCRSQRRWVSRMASSPSDRTSHAELDLHGCY
jgi:hypothetical protein